MVFSWLIKPSPEGEGGLPQASRMRGPELLAQLGEFAMQTSRCRATQRQRQRSVTVCARREFACGSKVVSVTPLIKPFAIPQRTASQK